MGATSAKSGVRNYTYIVLGTLLMAVAVNTVYESMNLVTGGTDLFAMYAIISIFIVTKLTDSMVDGLHFAKMAYIITQNGQQVSDILMQQLGRGITHTDVTGVYTGKHRDMLICVVSKKEIVELKEIVTRCDKNAFVIVSDVREALGEGFLDYRT